MLKVGMVGLGGISGAHVNGWLNLPQAKIAAVCDIRPGQLIAPMKKTGAVGYTDFDEMMSEQTLDIVDICLPTYLHSEYAVRAMKKGCHVLCEKPAGLQIADIEREYQAARTCGVQFMIAQVLRFWPEYEFLKEAVETQRLGKMLSGHMYRLNNMPGWSWDDWMKDESRSGLVPFDLHIHDLDFIVYAFGKPKNVTHYRARTEKQDFIHAVYEFDGSFITCDSSWYTGGYPFGAGVRFQFEKGVIEYAGGALTVYEEGKEKQRDVSGSRNENGLGLPQSDGYEREIRYFAEKVESGMPITRVKEDELKTVLTILQNL